MSRIRSLRAISIATLLLAAAAPVATQPSAKRPLAAGDIDAIAQLLMLEDTRRFDEPTVARLLASTHPEVRRRAVLAVARIINPSSRAYLARLRSETDPEILATVVLAAGQHKDADSVAWLGGLLSSPKTPPTVTREAARSLGKIRTPEARAALAAFLSAPPVTTMPAEIIGEALLSIGRFTGRDDLVPIARWATSPDVEIRWRAAWALFRPRDPGALQYLMTLAEDASPEVRFWAVRGLAPAVVAEAGGDLAKTSAILRRGVTHTDRRVRTESLRTLALYDDDESFRVVLGAPESPDMWLAVSAAEALGRHKSRTDVVTPALVAAAAAGKPLALRLAALTPLTTLSPAAAVDLAAALARERSTVARTSAVQALQRLGDLGRARLDALSADPAMKDLVAAAGGQRGRGPAEAPKRVDADYRRIAERWIVPNYNGAAKPRAVLTTPRGEIEVELHAGEAPLGLASFVHAVEAGDIVGTEFGRVVPDFVAQQRPIRNALTLRDEVSRLGLTRGNLSWASSGLDTGRPGYTLGITPQPHNEGDFTALGRIVRGMDVLERLELGDAVTMVTMK
jgi:cyclophilin family peptidyl-prolyl cis-trans isomerase/HEAT repeat protein